MKGVIVDSNIILDLVTDDPKWADWSESILDKLTDSSRLFINFVIYSEISIAFERIEDLEATLNASGFEMLDIPKEALFLAGKAFYRYKNRQGVKRSPLPDFYIGAQAAVMDLDLVTRDIKRYQAYFPTVHLIAPLASDP